MIKNLWLAATLAGSAVAGSPGADGIGDPYLPQDGNGGYQVAHYDVGLDYDPAKPDFLIGDTTAHAVATQDLSRFDLDFEGFAVQSVSIDGVPAKSFSREGEHELVITPSKAIRRGAPFAVRVTYAGTPGIYWSTSSAEGAVHVFGEPHAASSWYPVNDHPSDKATFRLRATVPDGWTVVGNGVPSPPKVRDGKKTFEWTENQPVASYLTGLVIDKMSVYTSKLKDGTAVVDAYPPGGEASKPQEDRLPEVMDFLTGKFGRYPFSSVGGIFYPGDSGGGFELQDRPVYPGGVSAAQFTTIVHEVAHQWFGNSVSVKNWRDICLKECFATYSEWLWNEAKQGDNLDEGYRRAVAEHRNDPDFWKYPLADPGDTFSYGGSYTVGPLMLHALRRTIGDPAFFTTLKEWQNRYRYSNASWSDFEKLAMQVAHRDLTGFFQAWAHSTKIPAAEYLYPGSLRSSS